MNRLDDRAVSPVAGYVLTLGITAILIGGLFVAAGTFVTEHKESTAESELQVIGQQVSADIAAADRLTRTGGTSEVRVGRTLPDRVLGSQFSLSVRHDDGGPTEPYLLLEATDLDVQVTVGLTSKTHVSEATVGSGKVVVEFDNGDLVIKNA